MNHPIYPISADDPAPASSEGGMDTDIIMINMNMANIQMNMGDFRGSEYAGDGFSYNNTMQFLRVVFKSSIQNTTLAHDFENPRKWHECS